MTKSQITDQSSLVVIAKNEDVSYVADKVFHRIAMNDFKTVPRCSEWVTLV